MKVLNYLQYSCSSIAVQVEFDKYLKRFYQDAREFYSQPFKPELITELFEGWEYDGILEENILNKDGSIIETINFRNFSTNEYNDDISIYEEKGYILIEGTGFIIPITLDDFIRDCQRIGLELKGEELWKKLMNLMNWTN